MGQTIPIERVDHIGIWVRNLDHALAFYAVLGFDLVRRAEADDVAIIRNEHKVEPNLVFNANAGDPSRTILMDVPDEFPAYTHIALRVASIPATIRTTLRSHRGQSASARPGTSRCSSAIPTAASSSCAAGTKGWSRALLATCRNDLRQQRSGCCQPTSGTGRSNPLPSSGESAANFVASGLATLSD
jgi:catechol 2,3-dioxygenase-like lactoylglutathione lyase family enzyme